MGKTTQEILDLMSQNTYLVPNSWAEKQSMTLSDITYRTYCDHNRKYIVIELLGNEQETSFTLRKNTKWEVEQSYDIFTAKAKELNKDKQILESFLQDFYNEIHSLNVDKTRIKDIRKTIKEEKDKITKAKQRIVELNKELEDSKLLTNI